MSNYNERLGDFLWENRNSDIFDSPDKLYRGFILVEKDGEQSRFNSTSQLHLLYRCMYNFNKSKGIQTLTNMELPFLIDQNSSFPLFCKKMEEYRKISCAIKYIPNDNVCSRLTRCIRKLVGTNEIGGWTFLNYATIQGDGTSLSELTRKIYLSVDNKDLHDFALDLLEKCDASGVKYDFKVNADERYRRADNVVIYTDDKDFVKYINMIEQIKKEKPGYDFGKAHLLAYKYNDYIGVALEEKGSSESHSGALCEKIVELRSNADNGFGFFLDDVVTTVNKSLGDTKDFCERLKKNGINSAGYNNTVEENQTQRSR